MGGTQFGLPPKQINSLVYTGPELAIVPVVEAQRDPTVNDRQQPIDCFWRNYVTRELWWLSGFDSTGALWIPFTSGASGPVTMFPVPNGTTPVVPDGLGNVTLTSTLGTVTITGGLNTINFDLSGGGSAVDSLTVDTFTAPATTATVVPTLGDIRVRGAQVVAGTNPVRTNSHAVSDYTVEVQISQAVAAPDATNNGLSHFDSADFTVDADGFVSLNGTGAVVWNVISQATQPAELAINNGYICIAGGTGNVSIPLPAASSLGDIIEIALNGATSWTITQAAGQQIRWSGSTTTLGAAGSLATTGTGDSIRLVCQTANTVWVGLSGNGNLTVT